MFWFFWISTSRLYLEHCTSKKRPIFFEKGKVVIILSRNVAFWLLIKLKLAPLSCVVVVSRWVGPEAFDAAHFLFGTRQRRRRRRRGCSIQHQFHYGSNFSSPRAWIMAPEKIAAIIGPKPTTNLLLCRRDYYLETYWRTLFSVTNSRVFVCKVVKTWNIKSASWNLWIVPFSMSLSWHLINVIVCTKQVCVE